MTYSAIVLVLLSTCLHAAWNMYSRKYKVSSGAFCIGGLGVCLILLVPFIFFIDQLPRYSYQSLSIILLSSVFQAIYFYGVANAYSHGNLSLSYPLLRSIPILMVLGYVLLIGEIEAVSQQAIGAGFLIIIGCVLLPMQDFKDFKLANYLNKMMIFVLIAAFGTAGYSIIDSIGVKQLALNSPEISMTGVSLGYIYLQVLFTSIILGLISSLKKEYRQEFMQALKNQKLISLNISAMTMLAYAPILAAMTLVTNVSYIVAFRQASIPIAFLLGILVLKEKSFRIRWLAIILIVVGLIISALY